MLDITDAKDALLGSKAVFDEWEEEFLRSWYGRNAEQEAMLLLKDILKMMNPAQLQALRDADADAFDRIVSVIGGGDANRVPMGSPPGAQGV